MVVSLAGVHVSVFDVMFVGDQRELVEAPDCNCLLRIAGEMAMLPYR